MIDIIIPAYNAFDTITQTLQSIAKQINHSDVSVYIINDGSSDSYSSIIKNFQNVINITEIIIQNSGPGVARQVGIDSSSNEYLLFMDADDRLYDEHSLLNLINIIKDADLAQGKFIEMQDGNSKVLDPQYCYLHGKLYRRSFIKKNNLFFDPTRRYNGDVYEDSTFNQLYCLYCDKIATTDEIIYIYEYNPNSITKTEYINADINHLKNFVDAMTWLMKEIKKRKIEKRYEIAWNIYIICFHIYFKYLQSINGYDSIFEDMKIIKEMYEEYQSDLPYAEQFSIYQLFSDYQIIPTITFYDFIRKVH